MYLDWERAKRLNRVGIVVQLIGIGIMFAAFLVPHPMFHLRGPALLVVSSCGILFSISIIEAGTKIRMAAERA